MLQGNDRSLTLAARSALCLLLADLHPTWPLEPMQGRNSNEFRLVALPLYLNRDRIRTGFNRPRLIRVLVQLMLFGFSRGVVAAAEDEEAGDEVPEDLHEPDGQRESDCLADGDALL